MAPVIAQSTSTTRACSPSMLVSELSACDADRMPSRSIVPVVTVDRRWRRSPGWSPRCAGGRVGVWPQGRVGPVQLVDLRRRAPGEVLLAGLGEQVVAGVFDAVGEVEAGRVFGDQGPMPWPLRAGRPRAARRRRRGRRRGSRRPPRPAPPRAAAAGAGSSSGASAARAASHRVTSSSSDSRRAALATVAGAGLPGQGQPTQQARHGGRVVARDQPVAAASPPRCAASGRPDRRRWRRRSRG